MSQAFVQTSKRRGLESDLLWQTCVSSENLPLVIIKLNHQIIPKFFNYLVKTPEPRVK